MPSLVSLSSHQAEILQNLCSGRQQFGLVVSVKTTRLCLTLLQAFGAKFQASLANAALAGNKQRQTTATMPTLFKRFIVAPMIRSLSYDKRNRAHGLGHQT